MVHCKCSWFVSTVSIIVLTELCFSVYFSRAYQRLARIPKLHGPEAHDGTAAFTRVLQFLQLFKGRPQFQAKLRAYIRLWFLGAPWHEIQQDNFEEHLAYSFFYKSRDAMYAAGQGAVLRDMVQQLRKRCGLDIADGHNPQVKGMWHLNEPLRANYRPFMFYVAIEGIASVSSTAMACMGFKRGSARGINYFVKHVQTKLAAAAAAAAAASGASMWQHALGQSTSCNTDAAKGSVGTQMHGRSKHAVAGVVASISGNTHECTVAHEDATSESGMGELTPLIFLHGVGVGLLTYLPVIAQLSRDTAAAKQPMLVMEFKHVGLRLCSKVPTADEAADAVVAAMDQLGWKKACVVGHSYGTFVASRMIQMHGGRVHSVALIDPVCFGMFMPHLLHNFIYATPRKDCLWHRIKDFLVRFASREVHCAATFCRRFYWTAVQLDPSMLPENSLVILGGNDELLHGEEVAVALAAAQRAGNSGQATTNMAHSTSSTEKALDAISTSTISFAGGASSNKSGGVVIHGSSSNNSSAYHCCQSARRRRRRSSSSSSSSMLHTAVTEDRFNCSACSNSGLRMRAEEANTTKLAEGVAWSANRHDNKHHEVGSNKDAPVDNLDGQVKHSESQCQEMRGWYGHVRGRATQGEHVNLEQAQEDNLRASTVRAGSRCNSVSDIAIMHPNTKQQQQQQQVETVVATTKGALKVVYIPDMAHADFMLRPRLMREVCNALLAFMADMRKLSLA